MITVTGSKNKTNGNYRMHAPVFPYESTVYAGYTEAEMKRKYRKTFGLERKRINWVIL